MTNLSKIFTESVSQLGVGKPELEALTRLFKVCLESALEEDDEEDYSEDGFIRNAFDSDEDNTDATTLISATSFGKEDLPDDISKEETSPFDYPLDWENNDNVDDNDNDNTPIEAFNATAGTNLTKAYSLLAPKLLANGCCDANNIDNLHEFINWLLSVFETKFKSDTALNTFAKDTKYDANRMDKVVNVIYNGKKTAQLLLEINTALKDVLVKATLNDSKAISNAAGQINDYIVKRFDHAASDKQMSAEQRDPNVITKWDGVGFVDIDRDVDHVDPNEAPASQAEINSKLGTNTNTATGQSDPAMFKEDSDIDEIDKALNAFISVIPTAGLEPDEAEAFNKPLDKTLIDTAKDMAEKRASLMKNHAGNIVDSSVLNYDDDDL